MHCFSFGRETFYIVQLQMLSCPILSVEILSDLTSRIDLAYSKFCGGPNSSKLTLAHRETLPPGERFVPTASSFTIGAILTDAEITTLLEAVWRSEARRFLQQELGPKVLCDRDQSWVRRQYAPARYPRFHSPHGWHQDGALGFDFASYPNGNYPPNALLCMVTCWIALNDCGVDAPGLEFVTRPLAQLLPPPELNDARVRARFPARDFSPAMVKAGEASLFRGNELHRTFATPDMTRDRTSIELRFFQEVPERLQKDRFIAI